MAVNPSLGGEPAPPEIQDGLAVYASELGQARPLAPAEERRLARAVHAGDRRAGACLVEANLRLVVAVARRYASCGVPFLDLVQQGNVGLMRAVDEFELASSCRFSTYAYWCIRQAVRRAAAEPGRLAPLPPATEAAMERLHRAAGHLVQELGREPCGEELARELGTTGQRVARLTRLSRPVLWPEGQEPERPGGSSPDDAVLAALRVDLYSTLAKLTARERRVMRLRFGLVDGRRCSLEEIGRRLGLPRERIRQIEVEALTKLRRATRLVGQAD